MSLGEANTPTRNASFEALPAGWLAGGGAVAGSGALAASSCCVLPLALAGLGASGAVFSALAVLSGLKPLLLGVAVLALTTGWALFFRRHTAACAVAGASARSAASARMPVLLGVGTACVGLALVWEPYFEPILLRIVR